MEFFQRDRRMLYGIIAIIVFLSLFSYLRNIQGIVTLLMSVPGVLIAITFHEYAHAFTAYKLGDDTAKSQGRLTLNPFRHTDPLGLLMLLFLGFGWGRPVQIDSRNFNRKMSINKAEAIVAFAGPAMNFILAILFSVITGLALKFGWLNSLNMRASQIILTILEITISINIGLGVFNLIPLPPLDGSKILSAFLPYQARDWFSRNEQIFYMVFLVIWISGIASIIIAPIINVIYNGLLDLILAIIGV